MHTIRDDKTPYDLVRMKPIEFAAYIDTNTHTQKCYCCCFYSIYFYFPSILQMYDTYGSVPTPILCLFLFCLLLFRSRMCVSNSTLSGIWFLFFLVFLNEVPVIRTKKNETNILSYSIDMIGAL